MNNWVNLEAGAPKPSRKCPECGGITMLTVLEERVCVRASKCGWRDPRTMPAIEAEIVENLPDGKTESTGGG